ncbi:MAG TPA: L-histidine N(alpha)-methyltransferase [Polyangiaceae bacterium]|nr:L-histidine N(alpha)-methyltransferase [Polyangiaceae bacterium]
MSRASALREIELVTDAELVRREVLHGLSRKPKHLPCKLFYDAAGSRLFERICELDEYYLTRTELGILQRHVGEMAQAIGPRAVIVEFGSGASVKTRLLLDALENPKAYVPIDISHSFLLESAAALRAAYPALEVRPVSADYTQPLELPIGQGETPIAAFFPGSTIGNFDPPDAVEFLRRIRSHCGRGGKLLIGVDLRKDRATLEAAYDDRAGVTAEFNRNILRVLNREHDARFPVEEFAHRAVWNERAGRVEMHLVSTRAQDVPVDSVVVHFDAGERIVTEHCYKYDLDQFRGLSHKAGFEVTRVWTDPEQRFSVQLWTVV